MATAALSEEVLKDVTAGNVYKHPGKVITLRFGIGDFECNAKELFRALRSIITVF